MAHDLSLSVQPGGGLQTDVGVETAWYVLTLLLRMGRPAHPAEVAARLRLASASAGFLESLCRVPNSPIRLTDCGLLTVSRAGATAMRRFAVFGSQPESVPRFVVGFLGMKRVWDVSDIFLRYSSRKRKECGPLPEAKRRFLLPRGNEDMDAGEFSNRLLTLESGVHRDILTEVHATPPNSLSPNPLSEDVVAVADASGVVEREHSNLSLLIHDTGFCPTEGEACDEIGCIELNKYSKLVMDTDVVELDMSVPIRTVDGNPVATATQVLVQVEVNSPVLIRTDGDNLIDTATQMLVQFEVNTPNSMLQKDSKEMRKEEVDNHSLTATKLVVEKGGDGQDLGKVELAVYGSLGDAVHILTTSASKLEADAIPPLSEAFNYKKQGLFEEIVDRIPSGAGLLDASETNIRSKKVAEEQVDGNFSLTKLKRNRDNKILKKQCKEFISKFPKNHEPTKLPDFESFILEEEEGSGGYGTVYRARRKKDGKIFAIKCPHPNAHPYHVTNELKMLERFGGRSFIIKYEGSFKNGKSECFVLEHVEHDRPEVLKKEIDISEMQWYGYCMFRALSSLHKQGVVHRDVKPGNFLFSRKYNKGYLIDFNLALDLNNKHRPIGKPYTNPRRSSEQIACKHTRVTQSTKVKKTAPGRNLEAQNRDQVTKTDKGPGKAPLSKYTNKAGSKGLDFEGRNKYGILVADGSGITSAKDMTSTRTPSADRVREPLPCRGRKELINLVHEVMHSPKQSSLAIPTAHRKRVAAPLGKVERRLTILTPMPLLSNGASVLAPEKKHKNEGPCVGTKGFRAPEVLLKSVHQGFKVDVWSVGVTLLYLMMGRTPFGGDPDQNLKDIAKLRGSEDIWELAKLHNRESSFPLELYEIDSLATMRLKDWCEKNTKRSDLLDQIPSSLFDLVDKCLAVNPRLRISADEALMHDFFSPCRDSLRKQRILRQRVCSEGSEAAPLSQQGTPLLGHLEPEDHPGVWT